MDNAVTINTVVLMDILDTVNAIAMMDSTGFLDHAKPAEPTKPTMVLSASALLDISEISMETVSNLTSFLTATTTKDMIRPFRHVSAFKDLNT
jgi:hypothetical protein